MTDDELELLDQQDEDEKDKPRSIADADEVMPPPRDAEQSRSIAPAETSIGGALSDADEMMPPPKDTDLPKSITGMSGMTEPAPKSVTATPLGGTQPLAPTGATTPPTLAPRPAADALEKLREGQAPISKKHGIGGGILKGLEIAGTILSPGAMAAIPGTRANYAMQTRNAANAEKLEDENATNRSEESLRGAQTTDTNSQAAQRTAQTAEIPADAASKRALEGAQVGNLNSESDNRKVQLLSQYGQRVHDVLAQGGDPSKDPQAQQLADAITSIQKQPASTAKPDTIEMGNRTFQWIPATQSWKDIGPAKLEKGESGTWTLEEDSQGKSVLMNSKTHQVLPANGIEKSGTKAKADAAIQKAIEPIEAAQQYADDYLKNKTFTGPGDEALQEKFFELAKPTTGFRMTQPQMDMLQNSRSWMNGLEAHLRHATTGTWFSDEQRNQIVSTMKELGDAKRKILGQEGILAQPTQGGSGSYKYNYSGKKGNIHSNDGKTWVDDSGNPVGE